MKVKSSYLSIIICALLLVVFNLCYFVLPLNFELSSGSFWTVYGFTTVFLIAIGVISYLYIGLDNKDKHFAYAHVFSSGIKALIIQSIICVLVLVIGNFVAIPFWITFIIEVLLLAVFIFSLLSNTKVSENIISSDIQTDDRLSFLRYVQKEVKDIQIQNRNEDLNKPLEKLVEETMFTKSVVSEDVANIEDEIRNCLITLKESVIDGNANANECIDKLIVLLKRRAN